MPFFQNPFISDFEGFWVLADRQASLDFKCPRNAGRGAENVTAWEMGPYNLSGNDANGNPTNVLTLNFSTFMGNYINWTAVPLTLVSTTVPLVFVGDGSGATGYATVSGGVVGTPVVITNGGSGYESGATASVIDNPGSGATFSVTVSNGVITGCTVVTGGSGYNSTSLVLPSEIVGSLNNNHAFSDWFVATLQTFQKNTTGFVSNDRIVITQKQPQTKFRFYVGIGGADSVIQFNKLAGVAPLPLYFNRHIITNNPPFPDSGNALIQLGTTQSCTTTTSQPTITTESTSNLSQNMLVYGPGIPNNATITTVNSGTEFTISASATATGLVSLSFMTPVQASVINNALSHKGTSLDYSASNVPSDSALLRGRSGLFMVTNNGDYVSTATTTSIVYQAGANVGDMAKRIVKSGTSTIEEPYTLLISDIILPP